MADVFEDVHAPEGTASLSVADIPLQIVAGPDIAPGIGLMVSVVVAVVVPQELVAVSVNTPELATVGVNVFSSAADE